MERVIKGSGLVPKNEPIEAQHRLAALQHCSEELSILRGEIFRLRKDSERYAFAKTLEGQVIVTETFKNHGAAALDRALDDAIKGMAACSEPVT